jgi:hypothetical protein
MPRGKSFFSLAKRSFAFWFGGIWLFCGASFLIIGTYVGIDALRLDERLKKEAEVAEGMVLTKSIRGNKINRTYWVGYRFLAPDGTVVKNEVQVKESLWDQVVERGSVRVMYLPSHPETNRIEGAETRWPLALTFTGAGLVFVPIGGLIFFRSLRGVLRESRRGSEGTVAEATVIEVGPAGVSFNGVPQWRIRYRYQDYRGGIHTGESGLMSPVEAQEWKVGDKGTARFDAKAPKKSVWSGRS